MPSSDRNEGAPLLNGSHYESANPKTRGVVWGLLTVLFALALVVLLGFPQWLGQSFAPWLGNLPRDPALAALAILDCAPVIVSLICASCYAPFIFLFTIRMGTSVKFLNYIHPVDSSFVI